MRISTPKMRPAEMDQLLMRNSSSSFAPPPFQPLQSFYIVRQPPGAGSCNFTISKVTEHQEWPIGQLHASDCRQVPQPSAALTSRAGPAPHSRPPARNLV